MAASPIDVHEEDQDDRLTKRRNLGYDWIPIASPKYDFEYPLPKFGEAPSYPVLNVEYDDRKNPCFQWPHKYSYADVSDFVAVDQLLFTPERDFLINNSGREFPAAHLQDKILAILFLSPLPKAKYLSQIEHFIGVLKAVYAELRSSNRKFEVVFVAEEGEGGHDQTHFDDYFNLMPWLAIPYSDTNARKICSKTFGCDGPVTCITLQTNGYILQDWHAIFTIYGAKGFPFTDQRAEELEKENLRFFTDRPSMKELLGDFIISPQGDQVSPVYLENKVVGLLFLTDYDIAKWLLSAWKEVKALHGEFEIVVVHKPYHASFEYPWLKEEYSSLKQDGLLPWYSLQDIPLCQKLWWIYHPPQYEVGKHPGFLVMIGPQHNRFFSYYARDIWYKFGAEAYPFTLERAEEVFKENFMKLELSSLLGKEHLACASDREKVTPVSELLGKEVVVLVSATGESWHKVRGKILSKLEIILKRWVEFPTVYISIEGVTDEDFAKKDQVMLCPSESAYRNCQRSGLLGPYEYAQVAVFGQDGRLESKLYKTSKQWSDGVEELRPACDIGPAFLHHPLVCVGWTELNGDRFFSGIDYM